MQRILILDQDKLYVRSITSQLIKNGYSVDVAINAQSAIAKIDKVAPDLILCEVLLTGHNGLEFMHELRSYPEWQGIPLIVLSRIDKLDIQITKKNMMDYGIIDIWYKPEVSMQSLLEKIERILNRIVSIGNINNEDKVR